MMVLRWLLQLLIGVLLVRVVWGFVAGLVRGATEPKQRSGGRAVALVRDPVCGTFIEPARAIEARVGSTIHYFCSESCRARFRQTA